MTHPGHDEQGRLDEPSLEAATADLERIRQRLRAAAKGDADADDVKDAVETYWHDHEAVLRTAAASLTEEVRLQALSELYRWREQLDTQLRRGPEPGTAEPREPD
ncbi:hypothetical protein C1I92_30980 [Jiangella anatolica]|uniref:Uncharacterized protein n=2 Tax=Jiangella anatolica TaxID=2670374 RepID=A0A2W2BUY2_9ACTN|nr:hypothetical protein C1I92_30980 [Jiangella anatolica]